MLAPRLLPAASQAASAQSAAAAPPQHRALTGPSSSAARNVAIWFVVCRKRLHQQVAPCQQVAILVSISCGLRVQLPAYTQPKDMTVQADAVLTCSRRCCMVRMCTRTLSTSAEMVSTSMLTAAAWEVPADCTAAYRAEQAGKHVADTRPL